MKNSSLTLRSLLMLTVGVLVGAGTLVVPAGPAHATVTLDTRIRSLDLFGTGNNGPIEIHLTPGMDSVGQTVLAPDGTPGDITPGNGQATVVSSFFDVFFDIRSEPVGGPPVTATFFERIAIAAPCENAVGFPPLPPGCAYEAIFVGTVEGLQALSVRHFANFLFVTFPPPLPDWDFAERFPTKFVIEHPKGPFTLTGEMTVDARVPEPATLLLVLLGVAGATLTRRKISRLPQ